MINFFVPELDGLPAEYKLKEGRALRHFELSDIINNTEALRFMSRNEGGTQEHAANNLVSHGRTLGDDLRNHVLIDSGRRASTPIPSKV